MSTTMPTEVLGRRDRYELRLYETPVDFSASLPDLPLYSQARHLATQGPEPLVQLVLWDTPSAQALALLPFGRVGNTLVSLPRAPFGGFATAEGTPPDLLFFLLDCLKKWAAARHYTRLVIKLPAAAYDPVQVARQRHVLEAAGFAVEGSSLNLHIPVGRHAFSQIIHLSEQKRLRKCQRTGFVAEEWPHPPPDEVYDFVEESRRQQGYALTIDRPQLRQLLQELPNAARVFVVRDGAAIASLTIALRVNAHILYNFCPADNLAYRAYSPTVLLDAALYTFAQREGIRCIDLGVSLDHFGQEKASLVRFKQNLGGVGSEKVTYAKEILGQASDGHPQYFS